MYVRATSFLKPFDVNLAAVGISTKRYLPFPKRLGLEPWKEKASRPIRRRLSRRIVAILVVPHELPDARQLIARA